MGKILEKFSINKEGIFSICLALFATLILFFLNSAIGVVALFCSLLVVYFFRDPQRVIPMLDKIALAPADGVVCSVELQKPPESMGINYQMKKVSIFLSPLNVHVNRIPMPGVVKKLHYQPGKSIRANHSSSEAHNERQEILIELENGENVVLVQQTGFLTRRIVCNLDIEQKVELGKRFGIIKFGSRVTIYLPESANVLAQNGQTVVAGETIIATFSDNIPLCKNFLTD